jgi:hypothetical protein
MTKETEDSKNVRKASVLKGKSHALELLGESIGKTCACPIEAMVLGVLGHNPPQHWESKHTIGNAPLLLTHIARLPGNPPLN